MKCIKLWIYGKVNQYGVKINSFKFTGLKAKDTSRANVGKVKNGKKFNDLAFAELFTA